MKFLILCTFSIVASVIVEKIIETLHEEGMHTAQLLKLLITSKLQTLRLSWIPEEESDDAVFDEILTQVSTKCTVIEELNVLI